MAPLRYVLVAISLASLALSAPVADVVLESRSRIQICGVSFRKSHTRDECSSSEVYVLSGTAQDAVTATDMTGQTISGKMYNCDHLVELQVLKAAATKSGLCDVISAFAKAVPAKTADSLMDTTKTHVNSANNLFMIDYQVNNRKLHIVDNVLNNKNGGNAPPGLPNLNKAVKSYISQVSSNGVSIANTISGDFAKIVADAQRVVDAAFPPQTATTTAAGSLSNSPSQAQKDLKQAVDAYNPNFTVSSEWARIVGVVNRA